MTINAIDNIDVTKLSPGDTIILQRVSKEMSYNLYEYSQDIGCKLIYLQYGKYYLKDERCKNRDQIIKELLE